MRGRIRQKRGGRERRVTWDTNIEVAGGTGPRPVRMLEVDRGLDTLGETNPALAQVVEMHYFGGMTAEETALVAGPRHTPCGMI